MSPLERENGLPAQTPPVAVPEGAGAAAAPAKTADKGRKAPKAMETLIGKWMEDADGREVFVLLKRIPYTADTKELKMAAKELGEGQYTIIKGRSSRVTYKPVTEDSFELDD